MELGGIVTVLCVAAGIALWMREYRRSDSITRPVTLSEEVRSSLLIASEASVRKAEADRRAAKTAAKVLARAKKRIKSQDAQILQARQTD